MFSNGETTFLVSSFKSMFRYFATFAKLYLTVTLGTVESGRRNSWNPNMAVRKSEEMVEVKIMLVVNSMQQNFLIERL